MSFCPGRALTVTSGERPRDPRCRTRGQRSRAADQRSWRSTASRARRARGHDWWTASLTSGASSCPTCWATGAPRHRAIPLATRSSARRTTWRRCWLPLDALPADVVGYSMGARLALVLALRHPDAIRGLLLESPSPGIADDRERAQRRAADEALGDPDRARRSARLRGGLGGAAAPGQPGGPARGGEGRTARRAPGARSARTWRPRCGAPARASWPRSATGFRPSPARHS